MKRIAFKMKIREGTAVEYKRRHDEIWPEITKLLCASGISDYSIFLDEETHTLFAVQRQSDDHSPDDLASAEIVKKWGEYMTDLVEMDEAGDPIRIPLPEVYYHE